MLRILSGIVPEALGNWFSKRQSALRGAFRSKTIIGPEVTITGNIHSNGDIFLLGKIDGNVSCSRIFFTQDSIITGDLDTLNQTTVDIQNHP